MSRVSSSRRLAAAGLLALVWLLLAWALVGGRGVRADVTVAPGGDSFLYLFDPVGETFVFTLPVPGGAAQVRDLAVVSTTGRYEVWFTAPGLDRIDLLVYTDATTFDLVEYPLPEGSRPLNLALGADGSVWFTAPGRNSVGRLDPATAQVDEFPVPTANGLPADIDLADNGAVWFTEQRADILAHLVVTATGYRITEYTRERMAGGRPYGVIVVGSSVYLAQTVNNYVTRFTPPSSWVDIATNFGTPVPVGPYLLAQESRGRVWGTERGGDRVSRFIYGTLPIVSGYALIPTGSVPSGLAIDQDDHVWFTQAGAGQIGQLVLGASPRRYYYPLPAPGLVPTGIATADGAVWVLAFRFYRTYLPVVLRGWGS